MAPWKDIEVRFGTGQRRQALLAGLRSALESLAAAGCRVAYVDGSFVTEKEAPRDFDVCWDPVGVDPDQIDPLLLDFTDRRAAQKDRFGGELFPANFAADPVGTPFLEYFQLDRDGEPKGIIGIDLGEFA